MPRSRRPAGKVTEMELYEFIRRAEEIVDGRRMCRASLCAYLRDRGVDPCKTVRTSLVKELERQGLVRRLNRRSRRLLILAD